MKIRCCECGLEYQEQPGAINSECPRCLRINLHDPETVIDIDYSEDESQGMLFEEDER